MIFTPIKIGDKEYRLRYPGLVQISITKTAGKELFNQPNVRYSLRGLLKYADDDPEVQAYLLWKGIQGGMPELRTMKFEEAVGLRDEYLEAGDLDAGEKILSLVEVLVDAITGSEGIDAKKLQEKMKTERENAEMEKLKMIEKAKILAQQEIKAEQDGIGTKPADSASDSST